MSIETNPLIAEMERRCAEMLLVSQAVVTCTDVFEHACEPRPPKAEWFGKWKHWQVLDSTGNILHARITVIRPPDFRPGCECCCGPTLLCRVIGLDMPVAIDIENETVLPVAEKGPTIPIGWRAVGE